MSSFYPTQPSTEGYDVAQVCLNGHMVNSSSQRMPEHNQKFCSKCGAATITACSNCSHPLRGYYWGSGYLGEVVPDAFCQNCGIAHPWTSANLNAARSLVHEADGLSASEKESLTKSLDELVRDTPQTEVALLRVKKLLPKAGPAIAAGIKQILISVVTEAVKHKLWP